MDKSSSENEASSSSSSIIADGKKKDDETSSIDTDFSMYSSHDDTKKHEITFDSDIDVRINEPTDEVHNIYHKIER